MKHLIIVFASLFIISCEKKESDPKEYAEFRGELFGKQVVISEIDTLIKNKGRGLAVNPRGEFSDVVLSNFLYLNQHEYIEIQSGFQKGYSRAQYPEDSIFQYLKRVMTVGKKKENYTNNSENAHWGLGIRIGKKDGFLHAGSINSYEKVADLIEVIEVHEVATKTITSDESYYPKTLWVTFKIKATFDDEGTIDGTLKVKYLIKFPYTL